MEKVKRTGWKTILLTGLAFVTVQTLRVVLEHLWGLSLKWTAIAAASTLGMVAFWGLIATLLFRKNWRAKAGWIRRWPGWLRTFLSLLFLAIPPGVIVFSRWGGTLSDPWLRIELFVFISTIIWLMFFPPEESRHSFAGLILCASFAGYSMAIASWLATVNTNPFSLSWSEGNRFYDYSVIFGKDLYRYAGHLTVPYNSPGRYALWGSLFLIPGLPIWIHRLWNVLLWVGTPLLLSALLFRPVNDRTFRRAATIWGTVFIMQGPVYPHLLVPMILLAVFIHQKNFWVRFLAGVVISYYAGISRFTWAILPGIWLVIADLVNEYPHRNGSWWKRLLPTITLGLAGILPGMKDSWFQYAGGSALSSDQPLLWNRLLPNPTYAEGILIGALIAMLPVLAYFLWIATSRNWRIKALAFLAMAAGVAGTLMIGLTASVKIGGGSNLHNLDMCLLTLLFITSLSLPQIPAITHPAVNHPHSLSGLASVLVMLALFIPGWNSYQMGMPVLKIDPAEISEAMGEVKAAVSDAKKVDGQILFLDQRQLLTFGNIPDVELISDYEKKYMMDNAMGNNEVYFNQFNEDLRKHRFALIVSEIQKIQQQDTRSAFNEENNAYVRWVSTPILQYYRPIYTNKIINLMLLVPAADP